MSNVFLEAFKPKRLTEGWSTGRWPDLCLLTLARLRAQLPPPLAAIQAVNPTPQEEIGHQTLPFS